MGKREMLLWADALEQPERKQGWRFLETVDGAQCCLGVACEIAVKDGVVLEKVQEKFDGEEDVQMYGYVVGAGRLISYTECSYLPPDVVKWLGVDDGDPSLVEGDAYTNARTATSCNDVDNMTFQEIAQLVRSLAETMKD